MCGRPVVETVFHMLLSCDRFAPERARLLRRWQRGCPTVYGAASGAGLSDDEVAARFMELLLGGDCGAWLHARRGGRTVDGNAADDVFSATRLSRYDAPEPAPGASTELQRATAAADDFLLAVCSRREQAWRVARQAASR